MECRWARRKGLFTGCILCPLLLLFVGGSHTVAARNSERYDAAYECEGKTLKIECGEGELIHLIRANYGRYSITICNEHGNTDWSVNCMSNKSFRVLFDKCDQKRNCSIVASTSQFGDPCPNTLKYLEAHYQCMSAATTTTTSRPSPPWLITSQPSVWSTAKPTVRPPSRITAPPVQPPPPPVPPTPVVLSTTLPSPSTTSSKTVDVSYDEDAPIGNGQGPPQPPVISETTQISPTTFYPWRTSRRTTDLSTVSSTSWPESSSNSQWPEYSRHVCKPIQTRNLNWNMTRAGEAAVQTCPGGATGLARWKCVAHGGTAMWYRGTPDLSECRSVWLTALETRVTDGDVILSISSELSQVTNNSRTLYGGDMMITTKIIKNMAEKMSQNLRTYSDFRQQEVTVRELLQGVIRTGSNLLDKAQLPSWKDLSHQEQMRVATSLLIGLEENAFLLANAFEQENTVVQKGENILVSVRVLEARNIDSDLEVFPSQKALQEWKVSEDHVELTKGALLENSENGIVRLVFMAFDRLEEILQPQAETSSVTSNDDSIPSEKNTTRILNTKVISASLGKGRHIQLSEPVKLYFKHLMVENVTNPTCVFWDYIMSAWSEEGCHIHLTNNTHTVCECNHLTNFAVLMDVHAVKLDTAHQVALQIITYIGCIISVICLVLAILTFQLFRGLKSDRTTIHKNLCVCLLIAEVLFVCGIGQTDQRIVCGVVAGLLHFFFLCAFAWMFLEGFQLYVMLIEVFEAEKSRLRWYYLVAYGAPLLVVAISCIIDPLSYGTDRYCWLRADNYFIFSFVGPVILVILANLVFLSMAIYMMCRHANTAISMKSKEHSRLASASGKEENAIPNKLQAHLAWLRGAIVLVFLLGLTWTFGLLYLNQESVVMAYIFTVLNSLQGLFIFVFHCVQNEKVRKEYRKFIRRHSWLPKCLRCSKSVSGNSAGSSGTSGGVAGTNGGKEFASHNTSSNPSAPTTDSSGLSPHAAASVGTSPNNQNNMTTTASCNNTNLSINVNLNNLSLRSTVGTHPMHLMAPSNHNRHAATQQDRQQQQQQQQQQSAVLTTANNTTANNQREPCSSSSASVSSEAHIIATLPHTRNNFPSAPNIPKSATATWGPLNKNLMWKNISFKSCSRDSGHGGSEQEDSPRTHSAMTLGHGVRGTRDRRIVGGDMNDSTSRTTGGRRAASPYNHTYTEIRDGRGGGGGLGLGLGLGGSGGGGGGGGGHHHQIHAHHHGQHIHIPRGEDDPVYEEIERGSEIQVSDMSDEDGRRQSDMSRQSSRSYGDHRPLIPYSPANDRNFIHYGQTIDRSAAAVAVAVAQQQQQQHCNNSSDYSPAQDRNGVNNCWEKIRRHQARYELGELPRLTGNYTLPPLQQDHSRTVAVLDGHTVVCHLQPQTDLYSGRNIPPPSYSEC